MPAILERLVYLGAARLQIAQILEPVGQLAQLILVQAASDFLAVARNKRNRIALVQQRDCALDLGSAQIQLAREAGVYRDFCH
jgi:hypothetical protein